MADKLIDAEAVLERLDALCPGPLTWKSCSSVVRDLPDASLLLREEIAQANARIKELEGLMSRISEVEPWLEIDSTNREDRYAFYDAVNRFRTMKGGQDV